MKDYFNNTVNFYISPTNKVYKDYWSKEQVELDANFNSSCQYFDRGILRINDFRFPDYTCVRFGFFDKMHILASIVASNAAIDVSPVEDPYFITKYDLEHSNEWKTFKKTVAEIMKKHKIGTGIAVGNYTESWNGVHSTDPMFEKRDITKHSFYNLIEECEIIPVDGRCSVYPYKDYMEENMFQHVGELNAVFVKKILEDKTVGILFRDEN